MSRRGRRRGRSKPRIREREKPGAVTKDPPITLTCECGEKRELSYGERWDCEKCGRSWDTSRIPRDQYEEIKKLSLRYRALPVGFGALVAALATFFTWSCFCPFVASGDPP